MEHTPTPWRVMTLPRTVFIQANRNKPTDPYDIEIMGDDTNEDLYPEIQKCADAEFIVKAVNAHEELVEALQAAKAQLQEGLALLTQGTPYDRIHLEGTLKQGFDVANDALLKIKVPA